MTHTVVVGSKSYTLPIRPPDPGEECQVCQRRAPHPRTAKTPETQTFSVRLPVERKANLHEGLKSLASVTGATQKKDPLGSLLEALLLLGSEHRERLSGLFAGVEEGLS